MSTYPIILIVEVMIIGLLTSLFSPFYTYSRTDDVGFGEAKYSDNILGIVPVFASTQDLVRCSDGKLAGSPGECPATDQCPPPQNNSISNCVPGELLNGKSAENVDQNLTGNITTSTTGSESDQNLTGNITTSTTGSESENTTNRCYEDRSTPHTPRCDD
jgi:hypothetical protein